MKGNEHSDEALMLSYQKGDSSAFEELYTRHKDVLYRYFIKHCSDTHQSEELYQEVWMKVINSAKRYEPKAKFRTFLFTIAHNTLIDFYRKSKPMQLVDFEETESSDVEIINTNPVSLPEDEFSLLQKTKKFHATLEDLPSDQKEAITLHLEQNMSIEEIAQTTQVKMETAKSRVRYAKNKLKAAIQD